jgi:hypothetical protein
MKKNVLKLASFAAGLCVAMTLTSCHNGEDYQEQTTVVNNVVQLESRTLIVRTNVAATVKVGSETKTSTPNTDLEFANPAAAGTIQISATGRQAKSIKYNFKDGAMLYYDVMLESAGQVFSQTDVETNGATVTNGDDNKNDNDGVEASFSLGSETNDGTTGDYSITVFTPDEVTNGEDVTKGQNLTETPLAIDCKPDGAQFSNPIDVVLNIPGSDGFDISVKSGDEVATSVQAGDKITAKIPHFSIWDVILNLACADIVSSTFMYDPVKVNAMEGQASVTVDFGYDTDVTSVIATRLLKKMFGTPKKQITKNVKWNAVEGEATITASQVVKTYTFNSKVKTVKVAVYGKVTTGVSIETAQPQEVKTHGGGSN